MSLKNKLTAKAVDAARDFVKEGLEKLKQLDLDEDGQADVDQIKQLLGECAERAKDALDSTDFSKLASGAEQVIQGVRLVGSSIDGAKLSAALNALIPAIKKAGHLVELDTRKLAADHRAKSIAVNAG